MAPVRLGWVVQCHTVEAGNLHGRREMSPRTWSYSRNGRYFLKLVSFIKTRSLTKKKKQKTTQSRFGNSTVDSWFPLCFYVGKVCTVVQTKTQKWTVCELTSKPGALPHTAHYTAPSISAPHLESCLWSLDLKQFWLTMVHASVAALNWTHGPQIINSFLVL